MEASSLCGLKEIITYIMVLDSLHHHDMCAFEAFAVHASAFWLRASRFGLRV